jgi:hypothetical protein
MEPRARRAPVPRSAPARRRRISGRTTTRGSPRSHAVDRAAAASGARAPRLPRRARRARSFRSSLAARARVPAGATSRAGGASGSRVRRARAAPSSISGRTTAGGSPRALSLTQLLAPLPLLAEHAASPASTCSSRSTRTIRAARVRRRVGAGACGIWEPHTRRAGLPRSARRRGAVVDLGPDHGSRLAAASRLPLLLGERAASPPSPRSSRPRTNASLLPRGSRSSRVACFSSPHERPRQPHRGRRARPRNSSQPSRWARRARVLVGSEEPRAGCVDFELPARFTSGKFGIRRCDAFRMRRWARPTRRNQPGATFS